jgi:transposase
MKDIFQLALNITDPWFIKDINFDVELKRLDIHIDFERGATFHYEKLNEGISGDYKAYDTTDKEWRHLNFFEHECFLHARVPRIKTEDDKVRLVLPPWAGLANGFTLLFEALILQLASNMPVHTLVKIINVSDYRVWNILMRYVEKTRDLNDYSDLKVVGMDETSMRKGHDYITLFVDLLKKQTIFIAEGKSSNTITDFTEDLTAHNGKPENVTDVSCDMSPAFIKGVKETLVNAEITFDKFHIIKIINEAVDKVRKEEIRTNPILKNSRYVLLKNNKNLTNEQKEKLEELSLPHLNLKSIRALHLRENFQEIYKAKTEEEFLLLLKKWYFWATHSRIAPIKSAAKTIKSHWDGVLRWKISQINNGILEGLNSLVQAAKAKARGYKSFRYFKVIAYLITGKLNFNLVNKNCLPT